MRARPGEVWLFSDRAARTGVGKVNKLKLYSIDGQYWGADL